MAPGLSKGARLYSSSGSSRQRGASALSKPTQKSLKGLSNIAEDEKRVKREYDALIRGLSTKSRRILAGLRGDPGDVQGDGMEEIQQVLTGDSLPYDNGWEDDDDTAKPALFASEVSHEEAITAALRDLLDSRLGHRQYKDLRTWRQRVQHMDDHWQALYPRLLEAYLRWKYSDRSERSPVINEEYSFDIHVIDIYTLQETHHVIRSPDETAAEALVLNGFLGATPERPTIAISLSTLELFRDIRRVKASFSVEAFTKLVCYKYVIPYRRRYRKAISDAFDVFLTLSEQIYSKVQTSLGRDAQNWRAKHGCPPCGYKVEGEKAPSTGRKVVMDGNNSLKRIALFGNRKLGDARTFTSDYYIPPDFVNKFANEVQPRQTQPHVEVPENDPNDVDEVTPETEGDPTDGAPDSPCASNWKAAASDEKKKMWAIFEETGIFASACCHGFILWISDMIRSGELAKHPLAHVSCMIDEFGEHMTVAFDIGCVFKITLRNSSLGPAFEALGGRMCVNAFHGYSHAYTCQIQNHPSVIPGMGIEDLETLERVFSGSNQLAPVIRYASPFRRHQFIHTYFRAWDEEKYANLGLMLYNNYVQALDIIKTKKPVVEESLAALKYSHDDVKRLEAEERAYFNNLRDESDWDLHALAYVEALQDLRAAEHELGVAGDRFLNSAPDHYEWRAPHSGPTRYYGDVSVTRKLESRRRELEEKVARLTRDVINMELRLEIPKRWSPGDQQYDETMKYMANRKYQKALGKLQRLVIQRLFELHRLNVSQTAYRMRTHIAKSLQKRCRAIRNAVDQYNDAAQALTPPRPKIDWSQVSQYSFLEEFTLLQDTRNDLREKAWAQPLVRETIRAARRVANAETELENVNCEARRLHTSIRDEERLFSEALEELKLIDDPMYGAVAEYCRRRRATNTHNLAYLLRLYALDGFTGIPGPGKHSGPPREQRAPRQGPTAVAEDVIMSPAIPADIHDANRVQEETSAVVLDEQEGGIVDDEDEDGAITNLVDHLANIAVVM